MLKAVAARNRARVEAFAANWGYQSVETDWRTLVERKDIDLIDIASPNDTHAEIAIAAARAGKMVMCEKPLARSAVGSRDAWSAPSRAPECRIQSGTTIAAFRPSSSCGS